MNDEVIQDLKQFIVATITQQTSHLATKDDISRLDGSMTRLEDRMSRLENKVDDLSASVAEALEASNQSTDEQLHDHEQRITNLERGLAQ